MASNEKKSYNYVFNLVLIVSLTVFVYWLVIKDNPVAILKGLTNVNILWIIVAIICLIGMRICTGYNLCSLCRITHKNYSLKQGFINAFIGNFFSGITPSASGGQFVQVYIFRKQGIPISVSAGVLWMEFIISQIAMVTSVLLLILFKFSYFYHTYSQFFVFVLLGFMVNASVIVGMYALVHFPRFYTWVSTKGIEIAGKLHIIKDPKEKKEQLSRVLQKFEQEIEVLKQNKKMIPKLLLVHYLHLLLYFSVPIFIALALHIPVQFDKILDILALSSFVMIVNALIPLPGSSGGTEATFVLMFSTIFSRTDASAIMIIWRLISYYLMLLIGGIIFIIAKAQDDQISVESEK